MGASIKRIGVIAHNTFRESIRDKILYNIVFLAIALSIFSIILGEWSVFDKAYAIKSTTFSIMSLSGLLISIFVGISLVQKEIQKRTIYTLLSKPVHRAEFILGKYLGLIAVVATHLGILTVVFYGILWLSNADPQIALLQGVYLIFWELAIIVAVAMLFSSFSTPVLSSLFTLGVYFAGHLSHELLAQVRFLQKIDENLSSFSLQLMEWGALWVNRILPALYKFNITNALVHQIALPPFYLFWHSLYAIAFVAVFLVIGSWWFSKRDFL
ncbi:MAG: ABC transporter permease [Fibrobacter sp.]|nr:ABC transporter permease [Fibrobacter sp.]